MKADEERNGKHFPPKIVLPKQQPLWQGISGSQLRHLQKNLLMVLSFVGLVFGYLYSAKLFYRRASPDRYVHTTQGYFYVPFCQSGGIYNGAWSFTGIDLPFGRLTFDQAKVIDVAWNWIIGQGIQGVLALVSYRVFTDALINMAEKDYLPYTTFASLALPSTRLETLWYLFKGFLKLPGWRVKLTIAWLFISTGYILCFASLVDLMTGYDVSNLTQLKLPHNTTIDITEHFFNDINGSSNNGYFYVSNNVSRQTGCMNTTWFDSTLDASWHRLPLRCIQPGGQLINPPDPPDPVEPERQLPHPYNPDDPSSMVVPKYPNFLISSNELSSFYMALSSNYECIIEQDVYHWGFSIEWLQIFVVVHSVWSIGLCALWIDANRHSKLCKVRRHMGMHRAIIDISEAIREDLGNDLCAYSEAELAAAVKKLDPIKYYVSTAEEGQIAHIGLSSRKSEKVKLEMDQEYGRGQAADSEARG